MVVIRKKENNYHLSSQLPKVSSQERFRVLKRESGLCDRFACTVTSGHHGLARLPRTRDSESERRPGRASARTQGNQSDCQIQASPTMSHT